MNKGFRSKANVLMPVIAFALMIPTDIVRAADGNAEPHWFMTLVANLLPLLILVGIWVFFMRRVGGRSHKEYMERARAHMDMLEASNKRQEEMLGEIVSLLKK